MVWHASTRAKSPGSWTTRRTSSAYADRTSRSSGSRSTNPVNLLRRRQRKGSIARAYSWPERGAPLPHPSPEADRFGQGPVEPNQTLRGGVQHPEKTHKLRSESKRSQGAQEVPMIYPIERLLLIERQEGERQTVLSARVPKGLGLKEVVKNAATRDSIGLVWVNHVRHHGP
ncbi:unnamed protein product [Caretta caretta]